MLDKDVETIFRFQRRERERAIVFEVNSISRFNIPVPTRFVAQHLRNNNPTVIRIIADYICAWHKSEVITLLSIK